MFTGNNDIDRMLCANTVMTLERLTDDEAMAFYLFLILGGQDATANRAWPKVQSLFTRQLPNGGIGMHEYVKSAALTYLNKRFE